jgi:2-polyprenyl-6-methoxyphenol hydroxylase-like FAD-dependent oxidoreductase
VEELLPAGYRDVVVRTPFRLDGGRGAALVGDAAHAMSPQLGTGTSLALADAWALDHALAGHSDLGDALAAYAADRARHVRWYQWWTRLMMPVFQSDLAPLAWPRDLLAPAVMRVPGMTGQMVHTLLGDRTSPWSTWSLPAPPTSAG